jgi:hypothetical protein
VSSPGDDGSWSVVDGGGVPPVSSPVFPSPSSGSSVDSSVDSSVGSPPSSPSPVVSPSSGAVVAAAVSSSSVAAAVSFSACSVCGAGGAPPVLGVLHITSKSTFCD